MSVGRLAHSSAKAVPSPGLFINRGVVKVTCCGSTFQLSASRYCVLSKQQPVLNDCCKKVIINRYFLAASEALTEGGFVALPPFRCPLGITNPGRVLISHGLWVCSLSFGRRPLAVTALNRFPFGMTALWSDAKIGSEPDVTVMGCVSGMQ